MAWLSHFWGTYANMVDTNYIRKVKNNGSEKNKQQKTAHHPVRGRHRGRAGLFDLRRGAEQQLSQPAQ